MDEPSVLGMIYQEVMILRQDVQELKGFRWKIIGASAIVSLVATVGFQILLSYAG